MSDHMQLLQEGLRRPAAEKLEAELHEPSDLSDIQSNWSDIILPKRSTAIQVNRIADFHYN